jgi:hypothetical protein
VTPLTDWADALYLGALTMWPDLTRAQFREAATAFLDRHPGGVLSIVDTANGVEAELRIRYGDPPEEEDAALAGIARRDGPEADRDLAAGRTFPLEQVIADLDEEP